MIRRGLQSYFYYSSFMKDKWVSGEMDDKLTRTAYGGNIKKYWQWNLVLACTLLILDGILLWRNQICGLIALGFTALYFLAASLITIRQRSRILREFVDFASHYGSIQGEVLQHFEIPAAVMDPEGKILWMNEQMCELTQKKPGYRKNINVLFPEINRASMPVTGSERDITLDYHEKHFRAHMQRIPLKDIVDGSFLPDREVMPDSIYLVYMIDETELTRYMAQNRDQKSVVGLIYIDNYEDIMERTEEVRQSLLNVMVERRINKYFDAAGGLVKKLEKDKYLLITDRKGLDGLIEDHFSILELVKIINIGNDVTVTLSVGIGSDGHSYPENYVFARSAMEMALGRGGDQAVVKNGEEMTFFGGKTQHGERTTRVKSRMKAQAMRELILSMDNVITMGHSMTDMDSFGAAIGVYRAARAVEKPAHIVLGDLNSNIRGWVQAFREMKDYDPGMFITHEQAIAMADENSVVIVVDTNNATRVECPQILGQAGAVIVLDHHRRGMGTIEQAALSYIEPSASSSCEMIAEILQYFEERVNLTSMEADCIYAGMVLDTNNFSAKTGVRTFEAAAFLRRCGADVTRVRKSLRDNFDNYRAKAGAVSNAEKYMDAYAISVLNPASLEDPNVVGAQAANELLDIIGVKASFVLTPVDDRIFISARSIDETNVQLVMEKLGGGGHLNMAGAQLSGVTMTEAVDRLKAVLRQMTQEGEI